MMRPALPLSPGHLKVARLVDGQIHSFIEARPVQIDADRQELIELFSRLSQEGQRGVIRAARVMAYGEGLITAEQAAG